MPAADGFPEFAAEGTAKAADGEGSASLGNTTRSPFLEIQRRWHALRSTEWVVLALLGVFTFFRFLQALRPPQGVWEDSLDYEANARISLLSKSFWAGSRPPLTSLLWKFTDTPASFVSAQTAISVLAWGFLAITVGSLLPRGWRRVLAISVVLAFACTLPVTEWDWSVLSESLSLSALAAIFALSIRFVRTTKFAALLVAALVFSISRDEDIWTIALLGIAALAGFVVMLLFERREAREGTENDLDREQRTTRSRRSRHRLLADATGALGIWLIVLAMIVEVPAITSQRNATNVIDNLIVRIFPFPNRVAWFAAHGMPESQKVEQLAASTPSVPGTAILVSPDLDSSDFAALDSWIQSDGTSTYFLWLLENPGFAIGAPFSKPPLTFNDAGGNIAFYAAPNRISTSFLEQLLYPGFWGEWVTLLLALAFVWWRFGSSRSGYRASRRRRETGPAPLSQPAVSLSREIWALSIIGAIGPVAMLLAWQGDGQEVTRHMVEGAVEMRLGILLVLLIAALGGRRTPIVPATPGLTSDSAAVPSGAVPSGAENVPDPSPL